MKRHIPDPLGPDLENLDAGGADRRLQGVRQLGRVDDPVLRAECANYRPELDSVGRSKQLLEHFRKAHSRVHGGGLR